jgi:hypothetical protein
MDPLLIRLLVSIGIIWLLETCMGAFEVTQPTRKILLIITVVLVLIWLLFGFTIVGR